MTTDTSLLPEQPLQQDINIDSQSEMMDESLFSPQVDSGPEKKKISQQSLNDFYATVDKYPDYTFEEAIEDFPEIKENEELFDVYSSYYVTRKDGKYTPEILNQKLTEAYGYEINMDADFEFNIANQEEPPAQEATQGDGLIGTGYSPKKQAQLPKERYPEVPIVQPRNYFPAPEEPQTKLVTEVKPDLRSTSEVNQEYVQRMMFEDRMLAGVSDAYAEQDAKREQKAEKEYAQFVMSQKIAYEDISKTPDKIEAEIRRANPKMDDGEVMMATAQRLANASQYAKRELDKINQNMPTASEDLVKIFDAYVADVEKSGVDTYATAYKTKSNELSTWLSSTGNNPYTEDGKVYTNQQVISNRSSLVEKINSLQAPINTINEKLIALDVSPGDDEINLTEDKVAAYNELMAELTPLLNEQGAYVIEYNKGNSVVEEYNRLVQEVTEYATEYEAAMSKLDPELALKGPLAAAQFKNLSGNVQKYLESEGLSLNEYNEKIGKLNSFSDLTAKYINRPAVELKKLDAESLQLNAQLSKYQNLLSVNSKTLANAEARFMKNLAKKTTGSGVIGLAMSLSNVSKLSKEEQDALGYTEYVNALNADKRYKAQIKTINGQLIHNTNKYEKISEVQRYMKDPEWKQKIKKQEFDALSNWQKAGLMIAQDMYGSVLSIGQTFTALGELYTGVVLDLGMLPGIPSLPGSTGMGFWQSGYNSQVRDKLITAYNGQAINAIQKSLTENSQASVRNFIDLDDPNNIGWNALSMFSQAGASLSTSIAGTIVSGGNPYVGGMIAFSQVYGDSYYTAKEAGLDNDYAAHLFAGMIGTVAAAGEKYALSKFIKSFNGTSKASLTQYIRTAIAEQGGKVTGSNISAITKAVANNIILNAVPETYEEGVEGAFELGLQTMANLFVGTEFKTPDDIEGYLNQVLENAAGGLAGGLMMGVPASFKTMIDPGLSGMVHEIVFSEDGAETEKRLMSIIQSNLDGGIIDKANHDKLIGRIESLKQLYTSGAIPKSIKNPKAFIKAAALVQERNELNEVIKISGPELAVAETQRIEEINSMLAEIGEGKIPKERLFIEDIKDADEYTKKAIEMYYGAKVEPSFGPQQEGGPQQPKTAEELTQEPLDITPVTPEAAPQVEAAPAPQVEAAPVPQPKAAPKGGKAGRYRINSKGLRRKRVFPKRPKPAPETPSTPNGVPVTATVEQQQQFADTPMSDVASRQGAYVNYQGVEGTLITTGDGLPAIKTSDGSNYIIEGALPERSMSEIGIELVRDFDTQEAMTPEEVEAIGETDDTDATAVVADFSNNKVNVYGSDYEYVRTNVDPENDVASVTLKDPKTGKEITVRNENMVFAIEEAKIRFEQGETAPITIEDVKQTAESLGITPITDETATATEAATTTEAAVSPGGEGAVKVQPQRQAKAPVRAAGRQEVKSPDYAANYNAAKTKGQEIGVTPSVLEGTAAAVATSLNSPESAKAFAAIKAKQITQDAPKNSSTQMFEAATGIELTNDVESNNAKIDEYFGAKPAVQQQVQPTKPTTNAVQEQAAGQVPVQPESRVSETMAQGEPQAEPQVAAEQVKVEPKKPEVKVKEEVKAVVNKPLGTLPENTKDISGIGAGYLKNNLWASNTLGRNVKSGLLNNLKKALSKKRGRAFIYFINPNLTEGSIGQDYQYENALNDELSKTGKPTLSASENAKVENKVGKNLANQGIKAQQVGGPEDGTFRIFDTENTDLVGYVEVTPEILNRISDPNITDEQAKQILFDEAGISMDENILMHANENSIDKYKPSTKQPVQTPTATVEPQTTQEESVPTPEEAKSIIGYKVNNIRDLYNVNRNLFKKGRLQSLASAIVMDRLIKRRASLLGITPEQLYAKLEFRAAQNPANPKSNISFQYDNMYHSSGHYFNQFLMENVGKGEGFQYYGFGAYFTSDDPYRQIYAKGAAEHAFRFTFTLPNVKSLGKYAGKEIKNISSSDLNLSSSINRGLLPKIGEYFNGLYSDGKIKYSGNDVLFKLDDVWYNLTKGEIPPNSGDLISFGYDEDIPKMEDYYTNEDFYDLIGRSGLTPNELENDYDAVSEALNNQINKKDIPEYHSDIIRLLRAQMEYAEEFINTNIEAGVDVSDPSNLDVANQLTQDRFLDYLSKRPDAGRLLGIIRRYNVKFDTSSYSYITTLFKGMSDSRERLLQLHNLVGIEDASKMAEYITENGLDKAMADEDGNVSMAELTKSLLSNSLLEYLSDSYMMGAESLAEIMRPKVVEYLSSVDAILNQYGLKLVLTPPVSRDVPNSSNTDIRMNIIDTKKLSSKEKELLDKYYSIDKMLNGIDKEGNILFLGQPKKVDSKNYDKVENSMPDSEGTTILNLIVQKGDAYNDLNSLLPTDIYHDALGMLGAMNTPRVWDMPNMITKLLGGGVTNLRTQYLIEGTRYKGVDIFDSNGKVKTYPDNTATGYDYLHTLESIFAAQGGQYFALRQPNDIGNYFSHNPQIRYFYQKKATAVLNNELGFVGNIHPIGVNNSQSLNRYRDKTQEELGIFNMVVFMPDENVSIDKILKFQHDESRSDSAIKFAADAQAVQHIMTVEPGMDPIAALVGTFETYLDENERATVVKAAKTGTWTTDTSKFFRKHFLDYLGSGKTPFKELQKVFDKFKEWMLDAISSVSGNKTKAVKISKEMRALYDSMLAPVNEKVSVPAALNPPLPDAPMPNHSKGDKYMGLGGVFYTVVDTDAYGNTTVKDDFSGNTFVWTPSKIAQDLADNKMAKVEVVKSVNKRNQKAAPSTTPVVEATAEKRNAPEATKAKPAASPTTARTATSQDATAKSGPPTIAARIEESQKALDAAPAEAKVAKDRSQLRRIYESLFGLDKRKAQLTAVVAERILNTIAERTGKSLKEVYEIVSYQRTTGKDLAESVGQVAPEGKIFRGAMTWISDAEAIIYALENPNVSTPLHELAHVYEKYLTEQEIATISGWYGAEPGTTKFSEKFARGFERYLYDGVAPSLKMKEIFDNFKKWMKEIYTYVNRDSPLNLTLNQDMRDIYATMLGEKPYKRTTRIMVDNAAVSIHKSPTYVSDGIFHVYVGDEKIADMVYNRITNKWEGVAPYKFSDIAGTGRTEVVNEIVTRHNNKMVEDAENDVKPEPAEKTPIKSLPPVVPGLKYKDENGQEYKVISVSGEDIAVRRTDSNFGKKIKLKDLRKDYANGKIKIIESKATTKKAQGIDSDIQDLSRALNRKTSVSTGKIGIRGEEKTDLDAEEIYDIKESKRIGPVSTRFVQSLGSGRIIKIADDRAGAIQNLAEGVESFTPFVLESGNDYVIVEEIKDTGSKALESFRNWLASTTAEDWSKKTDKLRNKLKEYGLENILNDEYSLLYGDITAADQWGERNGQIILLDAGSLVAGFQQKKEFDKAEQMLRSKGVVSDDEILVSSAEYAKSAAAKKKSGEILYQDDDSSQWNNLIAKNPQAHKAIMKMTKKLVKANGNSANDLASILIDTMDINFPDMGLMPKDVAFDYVVKAMSEMGLQPDFTGVVQQPDESELSAGALDEKTVFNRIKDSPTAPSRLKAALTKVGKFYEIESQDLADDLAKAIIDEYGMNAAAAMVKAGRLKGATASFIYGNIIDRMSTSGAKFSSIANVINDFALYQRQLGRGIAALNEVYVRSPQGLYYMALNAMNQTNTQAVNNAMGAATGLSGSVATAAQAAAGQVANNMTRQATTGVGRVSTAVANLVTLAQEERLKALKAEAKSLLAQLKGVNRNIPLRAPTPKVQALQNLGKFDIVVQLGANFVKRGNVRFNIWASRVKQSLSSIGLPFDKADLEFLWETNEIKAAVQDVLDSGLAPLEGPIKDYMKSVNIKLADIVRQRAADRSLTIETLANDIANSLSVDPAVANRLATAIKADIDTMSKKMQQKIVEDFYEKIKNKFGTNVDAAEIALNDLMELVNNNQADPLLIAEAIKFAFGGVSMSDAQSDEFIRLAENVFKTREGSKNRQITQKRLLEFTNSLYPTSFGDKFWIFFYPNQLAGITTQLVNTLGNFYNSASQSLVYAAQDIRNQARMGISYSVKDLITSMANQIGGGLDNALTVMNTGIAGTGNKYADLKAAVKNKKTIEDDLGYKIESISGLSAPQAIKQSVLNIFNGFMLVNQELLKRYPVRFMTAVDNAFFQNNYERSIRRQTINELYDSGLRGKDLRRAVYEKLYGTDTQIETLASQIKSEMDDVGIPFFDSSAIAEYITLKQVKGDLKAMINILANRPTSANLPPVAELISLINNNPVAGPMITAAILQSDPNVIADSNLWSSEAKVAVREAVISANITENIRDRASKQSEYLTLKNTPEGMLGVVAATMSMGVNAFPPLRFLVPYVNVPFNIGNMFLDWFPLTSAARAYGLSLSNIMPPSFLERFGVKPTSRSKGAAAKFGLEYDPVLHSEQKIRAMYSAVITVSAMIHFVGKALGDDEEEEGPAITGGLFGVPYDKLGKNQKPYTVKFFGEEFSYENTPLFLVFATIGNTCDVIRELKASDKTGKQIEIENALTHTMAIAQYTMMSVFEALPISGLEGITEIFYQRKGTSSMPTSSKAALRSAQGLIKSLLTPVPLLGNNLVKQMEQFYDPRRYVNDVFDPETFLARATGHVIINTLSDGSLVMKDYLGREVVQYPGSRNIKSLEITEKSDIDKYIYANNFNFTPVSKDGEILIVENQKNVSKVQLKDDVDLFNKAYTHGGNIMRTYLEEFLPTIKGLNDKMLEKALIHGANEHQKKYVIEKMREGAYKKGVQGAEVADVPENIDDAFRGWGANKKLSDGVSYIDEEGSVVNLLRYLKIAKGAEKELTLLNLRAALGVKTEAEALKEKVRELSEKYNQDVNIESMQFGE